MTWEQMKQAIFLRINIGDMKLCMHKVAAKMVAKMAAKKAARTRPWDNILRWEHTNSFTRHLDCFKNVP